MDTVHRPDARKTLAVLREEWAACISCDLGKKRLERDGQFVFGKGAVRSVMFVGEGPGVDEEQHGAPFVGRSGDLLRRVIAALGLKEFYLTNTVCCRSCTLQTDAAGQPLMRKDFRTKHMVPIYRDEPPTPPQKLACRPRLIEEIYLVDPVVIVGLGGPACEALLGHNITITRDRGETTQIAIPGASYRAVLTDKRQQWMRKIAGTWQTPVEPNEVYYHFIPTLHPAYVAREIADRGPNNAFQRFAGDIRRAVRTYNAYLETAFGVIPSERDDTDMASLHSAMDGEND